MALLWMDGFDHYGTGSTGKANMLLGPYAQISQYYSPSTTRPRNGYASMTLSGSVGTNFIRRTFGSSYSNAAVGVGMAIYVTELPALAERVCPFVFTDVNNDEQVTLVINTDGSMKVTLGIRTSGTTLVGGTTSGQVIFAGTWHHIEMKVICDATSGRVIVNVDDVEVIDTGAGGVDTDESGTGEVSQVWLGLGATPGITIYVDDIFAWDTTGSYNNDFIGDKDVLTYYFDGDSGTQQWTPNIAVAHHLQVDDTESAQDPAGGQDGDTTYLQATSAGNIEELDLEAVPSTVAGIVGVQLVNMMRKTQAGASNVTAVIVEGTIAAESTGTSTALGEEYAYYQEVIERDPVNGTDQWRYDTLSVCKLKLTRDT